MVFKKFLAVLKLKPIFALCKIASLRFVIFQGDFFVLASFVLSVFYSFS